tara:strand:+ start:732 stop:1355 length:624 start_codon:yes stop_codon:yes gene_type:complete
MKIKLMNNNITIIDKNLVEDAKELLSEITSHHNKVSQMDTPKSYIKKKMGMDYVDYAYMRYVADKEFPGWSWTVIKSEALSDFAYVVHGRLKWFDNGVWREGDCIAAHRIQKQKSNNSYVDIGNDVKAANTDTIKKAFNMYMGIADDVYKNQVIDTVLTDDKIEFITNLANKLDDEVRISIMKKVHSGDINALNYKGSVAKIERMLK